METRILGTAGLDLWPIWPLSHEVNDCTRFYMGIQNSRIGDFFSYIFFQLYMFSDFSRRGMSLRRKSLSMQKKKKKAHKTDKTDICRTAIPSISKKLVQMYVKTTDGYL